MDNDSRRSETGGLIAPKPKRPQLSLFPSENRVELTAPPPAVMCKTHPHHAPPQAAATRDHSTCVTFHGAVVCKLHCDVKPWLQRPGGAPDANDGTESDDDDDDDVEGSNNSDGRAVSEAAEGSVVDLRKSAGVGRMTLLLIVGAAKCGKTSMLLDVARTCASMCVVAFVDGNMCRPSTSSTISPWRKFSPTLNTSSGSRKDKTCASPTGDSPHQAKGTSPSYSFALKCVAVAPLLAAVFGQLIFSIRVRCPSLNAHLEAKAGTVDDMTLPEVINEMKALFSRCHSWTSCSTTSRLLPCSLRKFVVLIDELHRIDDGYSLRLLDEICCATGVTVAVIGTSTVAQPHAAAKLLSHWVDALDSVCRREGKERHEDPLDDIIVPPPALSFDESHTSNSEQSVATAHALTDVINRFVVVELPSTLHPFQAEHDEGPFSSSEMSIMQQIIGRNLFFEAFATREEIEKDKCTFVFVHSRSNSFIGSGVAYADTAQPLPCSPIVLPPPVASSWVLVRTPLVAPHQRSASFGTDGTSPPPEEATPDASLLLPTWQSRLDCLFHCVATVSRGCPLATMTIGEALRDRTSLACLGAQLSTFSESTPKQTTENDFGTFEFAESCIVSYLRDVLVAAVLMDGNVLKETMVDRLALLSTQEMEWLCRVACFTVANQCHRIGRKVAVALARLHLCDEDDEGPSSEEPLHTHHHLHHHQHGGDFLMVPFDKLVKPSIPSLGVDDPDASISCLEALLKDRQHRSAKSKEAHHHSHRKHNAASHAVATPLQYFMTYDPLSDAIELDPSFIPDVLLRMTSVSMVRNICEWLSVSSLYENELRLCGRLWVCCCLGKVEDRTLALELADLHRSPRLRCIDESRLEWMRVCATLRSFGYASANHVASHGSPRCGGHTAPNVAPMFKDHLNDPSIEEISKGSESYDKYLSFFANVEKERKRQRRQGLLLQRQQLHLEHSSNTASTLDAEGVSLPPSRGVMFAAETHQQLSRSPQKHNAQRSPEIASTLAPSTSISSGSPGGGALNTFVLITTKVPEVDASLSLFLRSWRWFLSVVQKLAPTRSCNDDAATPPTTPLSSLSFPDESCKEERSFTSTRLPIGSSFVMAAELSYLHRVEIAAASLESAWALCHHVLSSLDKHPLNTPDPLFKTQIDRMAKVVQDAIASLGASPTALEPTALKQSVAAASRGWERIFQELSTAASQSTHDFLSTVSRDLSPALISKIDKELSRVRCTALQQTSKGILAILTKISSKKEELSGQQNSLTRADVSVKLQETAAKMIHDALGSFFLTELLSDHIVTEFASHFALCGGSSQKIGERHASWSAEGSSPTTACADEETNQTVDLVSLFSITALSPRPVPSSDPLSPTAVAVTSSVRRTGEDFLTTEKRLQTASQHCIANTFLCDVRTKYIECFVTLEEHLRSNRTALLTDLVLCLISYLTVHVSSVLIPVAKHIATADGGAGDIRCENMSKAVLKKATGCRAHVDAPKVTPLEDADAAAAPKLATTSGGWKPRSRVAATPNPPT